MKSLFIIEKPSPNQVGVPEQITTKQNLLKNFREKFLNAKLTRTANGGNVTEIVPANEPLHFSGFQIQRYDLVKFLIEMSDDLPKLKKPLKTMLDAADNDRSHILNKNEKAIWIDLGYGDSGPRVINGDQRSGNELQLVLTAVTDGSVPADGDTGVFCAATERVIRGIISTEPPTSGTIKPMG